MPRAPFAVGALGMINRLRHDEVATAPCAASGAARAITL